ncbi:MAG: winged helix-turn-helix domain-containing protein [Chloroflexota bacterium]
MVVDIDGVGGERRPLWLVLTPDTELFGVEYIAPAGSRVRIEADPGRIADLLHSEHPRLAIVEGPATEPGLVGARLEALVTGSPAVLSVGNGFELDLVAHEMRNAERVVHLRPREFQLLALLANNPGRVFTRAQLIDLAWTSSRDVDPRTVDVHIHALRSKIEPRPDKPSHLITIRGFGYRFDPVPR